MSKEQAIIAEIKDKAADYETNMSSFLAEVAEWADLFKVRPPSRKAHTFSNPRQTEFFRACNAVGTLMYRMMTAADPFFELRPADLNVDSDGIDTLTHVFLAQLKAAKYRANLLRACLYGPVFGTVICQEDYRVIGVSASGRKLPATVLTPRVLDQVMFDRGTMSIDEADWIATADITSSVQLMRLAEENKMIRGAWNSRALEAAANSKEEANTINPQVLARIQRGGFTQEDAYNKKKEIIHYYGKLDCLNDGIEYVCALVNRRFLVRFHANTFQHGRRNFRVIKWVDFDSPFGLGNGALLANHHRAMDSNRQRSQDLAAMGSYGMYKRRKNTVADEDLILRPLQIVDVDNPDDLTPMQHDMSGLGNLMKLDEVLKSEFRSSAGAPDSLQAMATDAVTATASALAQNEAIRNLSVRSEQAADSVVREHLENMHWNNIQNIRAPFNISTASGAKRIYPEDLRVDMDFVVKTTTDKDFTPKALEEQIKTLQILVSTKSDHPDQQQISIIPLVRSIVQKLGVNPNEVIMRANNPAAPQMLMAEDLGGMAGLMTPPDAVGGGSVGTPVGPVAVAP